MIELTSVTKVYQMGEHEVKALAGVDLHIDEGEYVAIVGPSGSGKSTMMNILGCLDTPSSGSYRIGGEEVAHLDEDELAGIRGRRVGFVFQTFNLFPGLTALENVRFGADVAGVADAAAVAHDVLGRVGLADREDHFPAMLSGGEQQRVAIARALATGNDVLLADEPTGELDFRTGVAILELLEEQATDGRAVVVVTHNREISRAADRVVELSGGRVIADGPPEGGRRPTSELHW